LFHGELDDISDALPKKIKRVWKPIWSGLTVAKLVENTKWFGKQKIICQTKGILCQTKAMFCQTE
jgi:hypothetical protein